MKSLRLHLIIEEDLEGGWLVGTCPALPGCVSQGRTMKELTENMKDAISLWLETKDAQAIKAAGKKHRRTKELALSF